MNHLQNTAILIVSFGTSYEETRKKTIEAIENRVREAYPQHEVRRAFTSEMIIRKLKKRDNYHVDTPEEAMERLIADGYTKVIVQTLHVIHGFEYDDLTKDLEPFKSRLEVLKLGRPLLSTHEDYEHVAEALIETYGSYTSTEKKSAVVLMGHGTEHPAFSAYPTLEYFIARSGCPSMKVGCVEGTPGIEDVIRLLKAQGYEQVVLAPFMLVAGDHAINDMASDEEDSWKTLLEAERFTVTCLIQGIGEIPSIQNLYLEHLSSVMAD